MAHESVGLAVLTVLFFGLVAWAGRSMSGTDRGRQVSPSAPASTAAHDQPDDGSIEYRFVDGLSGQTKTLVFGSDRTTTGVRHDGCEHLAEVFPDLDSASCAACHWQARISGAWFMDLLELEWSDAE